MSRTTMVYIHVFFLGPTSFICLDRTRRGFLYCLVYPLLTHLGWHCPLVDGLREFGIKQF